MLKGAWACKTRDCSGGLGFPGHAFKEVAAMNANGRRRGSLGEPYPLRRPDSGAWGGGVVGIWRWYGLEGRYGEVQG